MKENLKFELKEGERELYIQIYIYKEEKERELYIERYIYKEIFIVYL